MQHIEGEFRGARGARIYYQAWLPEGEPKAAILVVHGLGEHSGRYMNVVNHLVPLGYAIYGLDHLGHGKSDGAREMVERFEDFTGTVAIYREMIKGWQPGTPLFLLGHSMGGLIATYHLLDERDGYRGAIISAPAIKVADNISPATIVMGKVLSKVAPKAGVLALDAAGICRDPAVVEAYVNDPLVHHTKTPARLAAEMLRAMQRVTAEVHKIDLPFLVLQGADDRLVDPGGARLLYEGASSADKTSRVYEGCYHEVFNEPERDQVLRDVEAWLAARI
ncbi:MAG: alpha/beta hydrolase [Chloroflexi bacterium]|nr:alpha/beta hydrolase [Chloroflexota bacterium]